MFDLGEAYPRSIPHSQTSRPGNQTDTNLCSHVAFMHWVLLQFQSAGGRPGSASSWEPAALERFGLGWFGISECWPFHFCTRQLPQLTDRLCICDIRSDASKRGRGEIVSICRLRCPFGVSILQAALEKGVSLVFKAENREWDVGIDESNTILRTV